MAARQVTASIHAVSADEAPLRNLMIVLERCHIGATGFVVSPLASALAVTTEDERQFGITVVDIGAGTAKLAHFSGGNLDYLRCVPVGSALITADIARALHTPLIEAERIKALYGNLISARSDEHETFSYPQADADEGLMQRGSRAQLASVIRPRAAEILRMVALHRDGRGLRSPPDEALVLTGGGSLLTGMAEFASEVLQRPVRRVQAAEISGLPPFARTPAFSTATGLLRASGSTLESLAAMAGAGGSGDEGYIRRVGSWLKSGF